MFITCVTVFIMTIARGSAKNWEIAKLSVNPMIGPESEVLIAYFAKFCRAWVTEDGEFQRLLMPMILHAGFIHLAINMIVLMRLGRVAFIYLISGLCGMMYSTIFLSRPLSPTVGASGALFGLIGALFGDFFHNHRQMREGKWCYFMQLVLSTGVGLGIGVFPMLDNYAHVGGFLSGVFCGLVVMFNYERDNGDDAAPKRPWYTIPFVAIGLGFEVTFVTVAFSILYGGSDIDKSCSWCSSLQCIESPYWSCPTTRSVCPL
jgi:membrane associated rhomboid family serine protease